MKTYSVQLIIDEVAPSSARKENMSASMLLVSTVLLFGPVKICLFFLLIVDSLLIISYKSLLFLFAKLIEAKPFNVTEVLTTEKIITFYLN